MIEHDLIDDDWIGPSGRTKFDYDDDSDLRRAEKEAKTRKCHDAPALLTRIREGDPTAPAAMIEGHEYLIYDVARKSAGAWMKRKKPDESCLGGDPTWLYRSLLWAAMEGLNEAVKCMRQDGPDPDASAQAIEKYIQDNCYRHTGEYMLNETNVIYVADDQREYAKRINAALPQISETAKDKEWLYNESRSVCDDWRFREWANVLHLITDSDREYEIINRLLRGHTTEEVTADVRIHPDALKSVRRKIGQRVLEVLSLAEPGERQITYTDLPWQTPAKYYCWARIIVWTAYLEPERDFEYVAA